MIPRCDEIKPKWEWKGVNNVSDVDQHMPTENEGTGEEGGDVSNSKGSGRYNSNNIL